MSTGLEVFYRESLTNYCNQIYHKPEPNTTINTNEVYCTDEVYCLHSGGNIHNFSSRSYSLDSVKYFIWPIGIQKMFN